MSDTLSKVTSYIEIAYSSIKVFADDGKLDEGELNFLLGMALKDGEIDDDEKRVLSNIFKRVSPLTENKKVIDRMEEIKNKYDI